MNIIIKNNLIFYKGYKLKCSIGKSGVKKTKKEGDLATPQGVFSLGFVYYRKDRIFLIKTNLKKIIIKKNMGWCDDVKSKKYNKEIRFPFKYGAEKLYRKDKSYDILILIKYNYSPVVKKRGSAIFMHIARKNYTATQGCIALSKKDFLKILPLIKKNTKILIKK
jgi:L,D-peptidoglycan transpeptidase YkuD (ErfK/YbiS/YcfS/YnhG family)